MSFFNRATRNLEFMTSSEGERQEKVWKSPFVGVITMMHHGSAYVGLCRLVALWMEAMDQSTWTSTSRCEVAHQSPRGHRHFTRVVAPLGCREAHRWRPCQKLSCGVLDSPFILIQFESRYWNIKWQHQNKIREKEMKV